MYSTSILISLLIKNIYLCATIFNFNIIVTESIFGGNETSISQFPYQVSVRYKNKHYCGGSILDASTILTAAHCVHGRDYSNYSIRVGETSNNGGYIFKVVGIIEHPQYRDSFFDKDIAILKLDFPLTFSSNIQPIDLQHPGEETPIKTQAFISGWGKIETGIFPKNLHATYVHIISNKKCKSRHGKNKITENMLCAFTPNQDACIGDSGGPLVVDEVQIGIVSWGRACAYSKYAGVYTKVAEMYEWIQENKHSKNFNVCPKN